MVYDTLKNSELYAGMNAGIAQAFIALNDMDLENLEVGDYEITDGVILKIQQYTSKLPEQAKLEAHKAFIDVQYIISGSEKIGFLPLKYAGKEIEAQPENDLWFYEGKGNDVTLNAGEFAVFFPTDLHAPGIAVDAPSPVKKAIVKVAVDFEV